MAMQTLKQGMEQQTGAARFTIARALGSRSIGGRRRKGKKRRAAAAAPRRARKRRAAGPAKGSAAMKRKMAKLRARRRK